VPLADRCGDALDFPAVGNVADLVLGSDLACDLRKPLLATRDQYELPPATREPARDRGADSARATGYDGERWSLSTICSSSAQRHSAGISGRPSESGGLADDIASDALPANPNVSASLS